MEISPEKIRSEQNLIRRLKTENRSEYKNTTDLAYQQTLDCTYHFYEGKLTALTAVLEGTFRLEEKEELPKKRGKK